MDIRPTPAVQVEDEAGYFALVRAAFGQRRKTAANAIAGGLNPVSYTHLDVYKRQVFKQGSIESLDQETLFTIQRFFENNLNVSETSRGLFVHRNTLVYRCLLYTSRCV